MPQNRNPAKPKKPKSAKFAVKKKKAAKKRAKVQAITDACDAKAIAISTLVIGKIMLLRTQAVGAGFSVVLLTHLMLLLMNSAGSVCHPVVQARARFSQDRLKLDDHKREQIFNTSCFLHTRHHPVDHKR